MKLQSLINRYRGAENFVHMMDEWPKTIRELVFNSKPLMIRLGMLMPLEDIWLSTETEKVVENVLINCRKGQHELTIIFSEPSGSEAAQKRWCRICGSIIGDLDFDGRTHPGRIFKMKLPEISK